MAVRRRKRKNPIRTTGALVVRANPRRRKLKLNRRRRVVKLKLNRRRRKANPLKVNRRHRRKASVLANPRRRKNRRKARKNPAFRFKVRRFAPRRALVARRAPVRRMVVRRPALRRRAFRMRRRMALRKNGLIVRSNPVSGMLAKIPVVGPFLASVVSFALPAVAGAVGVEPTMWLASMLGPYVPQIPTSLFYPVASLIAAAVVQKFGGLVLSPENKEKLAVAIAAGGGAVGYYKWRSGSDGDVASEAGMLEAAGFSSPFGEYGPSAVVPYPFAEASRKVRGAYADALPCDILAAGSDFSASELQAGLAGPGAWMNRFGPRGGRGGQRLGPKGLFSRHAGAEGHRWGGLIKWVGFENVQALMALPEDQRKSIIQQVQAAARAKAAEILGTQAPVAAALSTEPEVITAGPANMAGFGAVHVWGR